jgi:hypothetical protein
VAGWGVRSDGGKFAAGVMCVRGFWANARLVDQRTAVEVSARWMSGCAAGGRVCGAGARRVGGCSEDVACVRAAA